MPKIVLVPVGQDARDIHSSTKQNGPPVRPRTVVRLDSCSSSSTPKRVCAPTTVPKPRRVSTTKRSCSRGRRWGDNKRNKIAFRGSIESIHAFGGTYMVSEYRPCFDLG